MPRVFAPRRGFYAARLRPAAFPALHVVEGVFIASLSREVAREARRKEFFLSVVALALSLSPLTPSVAFGDSSLGEGAFRDGGSGHGEGAFRDGGSGPREGAFSRIAGAEVACHLARRIAFCFVRAPVFACRGFDPPCTRFPLPEQKAGPFRNGPAVVFGLL